MVFPKQKYWSRLPFPTPGDLPNPGIEPTSPVSLALQVDSLPLSHRRSLAAHGYHLQKVTECEQVPVWPLGLPDPCWLRPQAPAVELPHTSEALFDSAEA